MPSVKLNIHNQCSNIGLLSPTYATHGWLECHKPPAYKVCAGDTMRSSFIIKSDDASYGVLIYNLQGKQVHESTEIIGDASSTVQLLVIWRIFESKELYGDVLLVEHDKKLDEDDLRELYSKNFDRFRLCPNSTMETWSLDNNVALRTIFRIMNEDYILDITISEVERADSVRIPAHLDPGR
jgi:hypothetical protein